MATWSTDPLTEAFGLSPVCLSGWYCSLQGATETVFGHFLRRCLRLQWFARYGRALSGTARVTVAMQAASCPCWASITGLNREFKFVAGVPAFIDGEFEFASFGLQVDGLAFHASRFTIYDLRFADGGRAWGDGAGI